MNNKTRRIERQLGDDVPAGGMVIDEQARIRRMQLDAVTFLWQRCVGFQLRTRYDFRGTSIDRWQDGHKEFRGIEAFVDIPKRLLLLVDREPPQPHYKREHMFSIDSDVVGFNLATDFGPTPPSDGEPAAEQAAA